MPVAAGSRLGPYEVLGLLGAGGMGEVYRARDPRLGREVAVKVLPEEVARDPARLSRFEREARAVAALSHPNILSVFDVGTHEGVPYVVTELLEGETLREFVSRRAPTQRQILFFLSQAAHGLEAAHAKGIVHRDVKPENLFVTADRRVKLLDFGLAKQLDRLTAASGEATESSPTEAGQVVGTVGYMSPEQVRGLPVDHRTDIFSFGVVAYELLSGKHPFRRETTVGTLAAILDETPSELAGLSRAVPPALSGIVQRCLSKGREERFRSAHDLALSLESVLSAPAGAANLDEVELQSPYPGLASFTEKDAAFFFGRETEVQALWQRLETRKLLAVIAPSGAGKTSFLRAGVIPARPGGWRAAWATPGTRPALNLAHALTPELAGDAEAWSDLLQGVNDMAESGDGERVVSAVKRWRSLHGEALLVVDQFEELFTLSAKETQERFAVLLGRLAGEAGVHVVLSLRDDFLIRCSEHAPLAPVFESLTPLPGLTTDGLRRALEEPAKKRGYRFEDDALVAEMVESVEGARAALPLLAFAVARLWEKREREKKVLTRAAYEEVGGVAGALAQHAEATMDRVGAERQAVVREIFRNLVTAPGTRAVADREELLSVFPERKAAEGVLRELIDARLLTSYEVEGREGEASHHRIEIAHESLLKAWPRVVRWQMQDEEGAVLRDQLKQAAHLWEEKGRPADLLWSGTSYEEYELWRKRYQAPLTASEEQFARAMTDRARLRRRLRTAAVAAALVGLSAVAIVVGLSRQEAGRQARHAEAARVLALGQVELDRYPTAAVAHARKSLEIADTPAARTFAVEALWRAPTARILPLPDGRTCWRAAFSPDGRRFAAYAFPSYVMLYDDDGSPPRELGGFVQAAGPPTIWFSPRGDTLAAGWYTDVPGGGAHLRLREVSVPDGRERRWVESDTAGPRMRDSAADSRGLILFSRDEKAETVSLELAPWDDGPRRRLGVARQALELVPVGERLLLLRQGSVVERPLEGPVATPERTLAVLPQGKPLDLAVSPRGEPVVTLQDGAGRYLALLSTDHRDRSARVFRIAAPDTQFPPAFDAVGRHLVWGSSTNASAYLWDLDGPSGAEPLALRGPGHLYKQALFSPRGEWLAVANHDSLMFWATAQPWVRVLRHVEGVGDLRFTPDAASLLFCAGDGLSGGLGVWPMTARTGVAQIRPQESGCLSVAVAADGRRTAWVSWQGLSLGSDPRETGRWLYRQDGPLRTTCAGATFDASGRRVAMGATYARQAQDMVLRVFDLGTGAERVLPLVPAGEAFKGYEWNAYNLAFTPDGHLLVGGSGGIRQFDVETGASEWLRRTDVTTELLLKLSPDGRTAIAIVSPWDTTGRSSRTLISLDLATRQERTITSHGQRLTCVAVSPSGKLLVTGDEQGTVRVGSIDGGEPHLLMGHGGPVASVTFSADGRWIASAAGGEIRLWPMPDVSKPPFHTLPYSELMAKLQALTNLQVVADPAAATGYKLEVGPFPGWKDVPTW